MRKKYFIIGALLSVPIIVATFFLLTPKTIAPNQTSKKDNLIRVEQPTQGQIVKSPLTVSGTARGYWFFEASFPIQLLDDSGKELAIIPAQAQDEWMTEEFVPFRATLNFSNPATDFGALILKKDNPSGLPEHDDELRIPVRFR